MRQDSKFKFFKALIGFKGNFPGDLNWKPNSLEILLPCFQNTLTLKALGFLLSVQHWGGSVFHPLCKIRSRAETFRADSLYYVLQNMLI